MHVLFANTGVQLICVPARGSRYQAAQIGYGWQRCRCAAEAAGQRGEEPPAKQYPYIQWQIIQGAVSKLFLAVDTTCGDPDVGYFCDPGALAKDFELRIENILDIQGNPPRNAPGRLHPFGGGDRRRRKTRPW